MGANKYLEAFNRIAVYRLAPDNKTTEYTMSNYLEDYHTIRELVDKQTPKKLIKEPNHDWFTYFCPSCGKGCYLNHPYCPNCGQAVTDEGE